MRRHIFVLHMQYIFKLKIRVVKGYEIRFFLFLFTVYSKHSYVFFRNSSKYLSKLENEFDFGIETLKLKIIDLLCKGRIVYFLEFTNIYHFTKDKYRVLVKSLNTFD